MSRLYFRGITYKGVIFEGVKSTKSLTFDKWLRNKDWNEELELDDEDNFKYDVCVINDGNYEWREFAYNINEEWKHPLVDRMCEEIDIDDIEKIIGEIGIRNVMKKYKESDYYNDDNLPDLSTDLGIKQVFYVLLDEILNINDEYYKEITKEEYDEWIESHIQEELDYDEEEEDDNDGAIVPITDDAFALIGCGVASCA